MTRFNGRYRVETTRLRGHDYASPGWYFVTICTRGRACFFGDVRRGVMGLSAAGCVAHQCWAAIPDHADRVRLDAFVVMPNHVHGLIGLLPRPRDGRAPGASGGRRAVETLRATSLRTVDAKPGASKDETMSRISPRAGSLGAIVRSYKSAVTRLVRRTARPDFAWQARFYDRVVRNERALTTIRHYIHRNPAQWTRDRNHPDRR